MPFDVSRTTQIRWKKITFTFFAGVLLLSFATPQRAFAQDQDNDVNPDAPGCKDSSLLGRINATKLTACDHDRDGKVQMPVKLDENDSIVQRNIRGDMAEWTYTLLDPKSASVFEDFKEKLTSQGFTIVFEHEPEFLTARKDNVWFTLDNSGDRFNQILVNGAVEEPDDPAPATSAGPSPLAARENAARSVKSSQGARSATPATPAVAPNPSATAMSPVDSAAAANSPSPLLDRLDRNERVAITDIHFDGATASLEISSDSALDEIVDLLKDNPTLKLRIAVYTNEIGWPEGNEVLAGSRAKSIIDWLANHGVNRSRLSGQGLGAPPPNSGATSRVELIKM